jgi:hydroxyacylglutathione hydrolase
MAFLREPGVIFLGDYDLTPFGPWYGDAVSDIEATIASVNRLRTVPARVWVAAHEHGVFESDPGELWDRHLGIIYEREARLLDLLAVPRKMDEIVDARILYGKKREPKEFFDFGERSHMGKHLERLMRQGVVICEEGTYRRA